MIKEVIKHFGLTLGLKCLRMISNAESRSCRESRGKCVREIEDSKQIDVLLFQRLEAFLEDQAAKRGK